MAILVVTAGSALGHLETVEARALDLLLRLQGRQPATGVVIVAIDDDAFAALGRRQPIDREYLVRLLLALERAGALVIGLDIDLTTRTMEHADRVLARTILEMGRNGVTNVILADVADDGSWPSTILRGSPAVPVDDDGVIRRASFAVPGPGGSLEPAFSLAVAARVAGSNAAALARAVREPSLSLRLPLWRADGQWDLPEAAALVTKPGELWRINFIGPARSFLIIPSNAVIAYGDSAADVALDNPLRGRIVLVGGTFREGRDLYQTPHGPMAGVEVHANLVHMLVTRAFIRPSGWAVSLALQAIVVLVAGCVLLAFRPLPAMLLCVGFAIAVGVPGSYWAFHRGGYWIDFVLPVLATSLLVAYTEATNRRRLRESFGRYVSPEVVAQVLADAPSLRGENREVSILVSDLRGFTALAETMPPAALAVRLNEYFGAMTGMIFTHRGMVSDFVGDAIMATFSAPVPDPQHAQHAIAAAHGMTETLAALNMRWAAQGLPPLRMGIGIHSGRVFAGNIGGPIKVKYAVVGDAVNVAARVEAMNKELGTTILLTEETRDLVGDRAEVRDRGELPVRGRARPVRVYELVALCHLDEAPTGAA